ncbi:MAG: hypothetical protein HY219_02425 [Candidatus Staskawiczbacteria bacterium]|nr:hypothetical protein [Candidatus Staskawiczbacteria bacterium]
MTKRSKKLIRNFTAGKKNKTKKVKRRVNFVKHPMSDKGYQLNLKWPYLAELKNLVFKISPPSFPKIEQGLRRLGQIKLAVVTGEFLNIANARVDLMVVGDNIDFKKFTDFIKKLENDLGMELRYVVLGVDEFKYRYGMFDRFVHDILEYPHRKVVDKIKGI